ncbi:MAG: hypothetical protein M9921_02265 [Fimbriimonadaceae bacterium]|nr:hypothetical protein [Fimbriimonadaceae bacterium]
MLCVLLLALGLPLPSSGPAALKIASFALGANATLANLPVEVVLENAGERNVRLWAPNNVEGLQSLWFEFQAVGGKVVEYRPPVPPRAGGVATAVVLAPHERLHLPVVNLAAARDHGGLAPGDYTVTAIYKNAMADFPPVRGVWTGTLRSKPLKLRL